MEHEGQQPEEHQPAERNNVRYLDEWRAQHRRYYAAKTEALRGRRLRRAQGRDPRGVAGPPRPRHGFPLGHAPFRGGRPAPRSAAAGQAPRLVWSSRAAPRRRAWVLWCLSLIAAVALVLGLRSDRPSQADPPAAPPPPVLHLWAPRALGRDPDVQALLQRFEEIHGVTVRWQSRPVEPYELFHAVMVGPAPDVLLVDHDMGLRLIGMDALLPLADPVDGEPAQYVLPLAEDTLWAQALRAAIPRRTAHPDLARALVAHLATAASSRPAGGVQ